MTSQEKAKRDALKAIEADIESEQRLNKVLKKIQKNTCIKSLSV